MTTGLRPVRAEVVIVVHERDRVVDAVLGEVRAAEPAEVPERLCAVAARMLPVSGAGVSLRGSGMPVPLAASSPGAEHLMETQATLGDGPCTLAAETGTPVLAADLTSGRDAVRWPVFAQQATGAGVHAVYSLPLGRSVLCVGTLDLYCASPFGLTAADLRTAVALADVMTRALISLPYGGDGPAGGPWRSALAVDHDQVYQAVGMVMAQLWVGADEALALLRARAFSRGRTVLDVAHEVVGHQPGIDAE